MHNQVIPISHTTKCIVTVILKTTINNKQGVLNKSADCNFFLKDNFLL